MREKVTQKQQKTLCVSDLSYRERKIPNSECSRGLNKCPVSKTMTIQAFLMPKLLELRKDFKEAMAESLAARGHGADQFRVSAGEAEKLSDVTTHHP